MSKIQDFLDYINKKTCNKFSFIRLKQVFFDRSINTCVVSFIYPREKDLTKSEKEEITSTVKDYIKIDGAVDVRINKSYIEEELVMNQIKRFFENNNPLLCSSLSKDDVIVICDEIVRIKIFLEKSLYEYFLKSNIEKSLVDFLQKNFYSQFEIIAVQREGSVVRESFLDERLRNIERLSDVNSLIQNSQDKYIIQDKKIIVGEEITFNPRYINSINKEFDSCVVAGKINFLTEKTYKSKRTIKNKEGEEERIEKPYFSFQIRDDTASIYAVIFPSKANYHKMHLLKNGDFVAVQGKIQKYNDNYEIMVKNISLCKVPSKQEVEKIADQNLIVDYKYIRPQKYSSLRQTNLFDESRSLSIEAKTGSFVVYDFETTGINLSNDEIIEIGALKIVNGEFSEVFTTLVKPKRPIPLEATKVNKITNEMVANCYSIEQVIRDFYLFCKGSQMVGYNSIAFDSVFLDRAGKLVGINFNNNQIDAFMLAKQKLKGLKNYKLGTVAKYLEVSLIDAHRALNDVIATAEVFLKLY